SFFSAVHFENGGDMNFTRSKDPEALSAWFLAELKKAFDGQILSVILYGSAVTRDFNPRKSNLNFLVVLTDEGIGRIAGVQKRIGAWERKGIPVPFFLTSEHIQTSLDSYPVEFLNMRQAYRVVHGEDVLKNLDIQKKDIRLQCERELKGKLIQLRAAYILTRGKRQRLYELINLSLISFTAIFKALLHLQGMEVPPLRQDILRATCDSFGLDVGLFTMLHAIQSHEIKVSREQMAENVEGMIREIQKLSRMVDKLHIANT
ncbi:hypothetical protein JW906_07245, partial [bacterium]|nr:hypothetical protein [bacterium]